MHWFTTTEAGNGTRAEASKKIGNEKVNMTAGAFIASNATMGEGCTGIFAEVNAHGQGFSVQRIIMHNFGTTLTGGFHASIFNNKTHKFSTFLMYSQTKFISGVSFDHTSSGLSYTHARGHSVSFSASEFPQTNMGIIAVAARANIWSSISSATTLGIAVVVTRHFRGPLAGRYAFGGSLRFSHNF
ncbi:attacin-A-like isoform X1 [Anastrepha obliqua]|uniref:attacin-A-like isoform X1 n=1 Tax=Anastrepha obliqua TaxID=95512 RepID=UPI002409F2DB|nr:attacin-A-like isoform X1 [Anastrepha obliqua]